MATTSTGVTFFEAPTTDDLPVVCAWCGATIQEGVQGPVSHGICEDCLAFVLARAGHEWYAPTPRVDAVKAQLARALRYRKGWGDDLVCNVMDGIVERAKTRVALECEVMWLAYETGLLDVVGGESAATPEPVSMPLADAAA
jgi:hypothetical protein